MNVNDASVRFEIPNSMLYQCYRVETKVRTSENNGRCTALTCLAKKCLQITVSIWQGLVSDTNFLRTAFFAVFFNTTAAVS